MRKFHRSLFTNIQCMFTNRFTMNNATTIKSGSRGNRLRVLVDMDGVLCDFEGQFLDDYRQKFPNAPFVPLVERNQFYIDDQYSEIDENLPAKTRQIWLAEGFFEKMQPVPGAIDAVKEMSGMHNVDVFLCTSALTTWSPIDGHFSAKEKFAWVHKHLGRDWLKKLIITRDKTVVNGDLLIDDKPRISGADKYPCWDHILFTSCHNKHLDINALRCTRRLDNWTDNSWKQLIQEYMSRKS